MIKLMMPYFLIFCFSFSYAQNSPENRSLPGELSFYLFPDNLAGRRGHQLDVDQLVLTGGLATAKLTMHGLGQDRCSLKGQFADGSFVDGKLTLAVKLPDTDNVICPMKLEILRTSEGKFQGRYTNSKFLGELRQR